MSLTDPAEDATNDARMTELTLTAGGIRRPGQSPDPSPTVLALAQALATYDGFGWVFTSTTKSEASAEIASDYIRQAESIAAHLPAPTVKPGRDAVLAALLSVEAGPSTNALADAVLAILPGKSVAQVRAGALRDAKARIALDFTFSGHEVAAWLDALADEEAGK